jgi:hypothetical protein
VDALHVERNRVVGASYLDIEDDPKSPIVDNATLVEREAKKANKILS